MRRIFTLGAAVLAVAAVGLVQSGTLEAHDGGHAFVSFTQVVGELRPTALAPRENVEYVGGENGFTGGHVAIEGDRLYLGSYGNGMRVFDISNPADPVPIGEYLPGLRADTPPDAAVFDGRHIAVLNGTRRTHAAAPNEARTDRTEFLDFTDPKNPRLLWTFGPDQVDGESHNGDIVDSRRIYLPSGGVGAQGLRIYDLSPLLGSPPSAPQNLFRGDPAKLWENSPYRQGRPVGPAYTHTHDIEVYVDYPVEGLGRRDIALLAEGGNYTGASTAPPGVAPGDTGSILVVDITDPRNPVALYRWLHEQGPNHHPIRYHHEIQLLESDPRVALVTDEDLHNGCGGAGGVTAIRFAPNMQSATELSEWFIPLGTPAPVCSVHVFSSSGSLVFLGSYNAGLQVVDYSNPASPRQVGHFIAEGTTAWGALYHEGYVYVGDMARGLDVFRYTGPRPDLPDLTLSAGDISFSKTKAVSGDKITITAKVTNAGGAAAQHVLVRFADNGTTLGDRVISAIPAGDSRTASISWDTRGIKGERTISVTADPNNTIAEGVEANNSAARTVEVQGNRVRNGSFEESSSGSSPDGWSSSGDTSYTAGGSDGERSVTAGTTGAWTSEPIAVEAGKTYGISVDAAGAGGKLVVQQLSAAGVVLASVAEPLSAASGFANVASTLAPAAGVSAVRIQLAGGLVGTTSFDNVRLWEE
ncbi:MAG: hypothetical protein ICV59_09265 [Thermoleophilia bacterium]|nr:hypothetical protein [Thermoleophilia bacterium]